MLSGGEISGVQRLLSPTLGSKKASFPKNRYVIIEHRINKLLRDSKEISFIGVRAKTDTYFKDFFSNSSCPIFCGLVCNTKLIRRFASTTVFPQLGLALSFARIAKSRTAKHKF